jgi:hypothetical protein
MSSKKNELPRVYDLKIINNTLTPDHVIHRKIDIYPGRALSDADMRKALSALNRLGIFEEDACAKPTGTVLRSGPGLLIDIGGTSPYGIANKTSGRFVGMGGDR